MSFTSLLIEDEITCYLRHFRETDICENCNKKTKILSCNQCNKKVCSNAKCSLLFPHHNNTLFIICKQCTSKIEKQIKCLDFDKIRLLKRKIKTKKTKKQSF